MADLGKLLGTAFDTQLFTDLKIFAGQDRTLIKAHSLVLSLASEEFKNLIWTNGLTRQKSITVPESGTVMKACIQYIYHGETPIQDMNVVELGLIFEAALKYKLVGLAEKAMEAITPAIGSENVFRVLKVSEDLEFPNLKAKTWEVIQNRTEEVLDTNLKDMSIEMLTQILSDDFLNIREVKLFELLVRWAAENDPHGKTPVKNKASLKKLLGNTLKLIRFPVMTSEEFANIVVPTGLLPEAQVSKILLYISSSLENRNNISVAFPTEARQPKIEILGECCADWKYEDESFLQNMFLSFSKWKSEQGSGVATIRNGASLVWNNLKDYVVKK